MLFFEQLHNIRWSVMNINYVDLLSALLLKGGGGDMSKQSLLEE